MARILIGWEIGAGLGHITRTAEHAAVLRRQGHEVVVALRKPHPMVPDAIPAPTWPGTGPRVASNSLGDVMLQLGVGIPGMPETIIGAWLRLLERIRPDAVVADFAPALLVAARERCPSVQIGNGYDCPPATMTEFPNLRNGDAPSPSQGLVALGEPLPAMFRATRTIVGALPWIDPYAAMRPGEHLPPAPKSETATGTAAFVYWQGGMPKGMAQALARAPIAVHMADPASPTPWPQIAATSGIAISHGGCGFVTQAALAGMPQILVTADLEKHHYGAMVRERGLGWSSTAGAFDPERFAQEIVRMTTDSARNAAMNEARTLRAMARRDPVQAVADAIDELTA